MMSFRCLLVLSLSKNDHGKILLFRRFPTVEKRCQSHYCEKYFSLPSPSQFASSLLVTLGLTADSKQFVQWRDEACRNMQLPVVELTINQKELWPVIAIAQGAYLVSCCPFVENYNDVNKADLLQISSISVGFSLLLGVLNYLTSIGKLENKQTRLSDLETYLTLVMPFGTPSDVEFSFVPHINKLSLQKYLKKQPAWKPIDGKGKHISIKIMECVRSVQNKMCGSQFEIFGQVSIKADIEGAMNEVTISLLAADARQSLALDSIIVHPCVNVHGGLSTLSSGLPKRIRFTPPVQEFVLLQYCSLLPKEPPIQGVFKMIGENSVELSIQLKLNEKVKNSFDYCDIIIVFFNRGPVKNMEFNTNHGTVKLLEDKYTMKWNLGNKFPKDLETALTAKVDFNESPVLPKSDPFCIDKNSYVQINFKQSNSTLSGLNIDTKNVIVSEGSKPKVMLERSIQSAEYRLWNDFGDLPFPTQLSNKFEKVSL